MEEVIKFNDEGYNEDLLREARELALLGLTEEQMAKAWGITLSRFNDFKKDAKFMEALTDGKLRADGHVAASLYKRAVGYDYYEERAGFFKGEAITVRVKRHVPPDPWSAVRWLSTRQRAVWSETQKMEITNTNININKIDFSGLSEEEMLMIRQIQMKQLAKNAGGN